MTIKLKFSHQQFQDDAVNSVCSVFTGQQFGSFTFTRKDTTDLFRDAWGNHTIDLTHSQLLANIRHIQLMNSLRPSESLEGEGCNLTIEMETGTGKTYTYIKTIYELNRLYGWSKFMVVVPSIAIREGVYKTFQITENHFMWDYDNKADYFIYNSSNLPRIKSFVSEESLQVMIINAQAFNSRDNDSRRIRMVIDQFGASRPIEDIAAVHPIMIIDEPQSVEGARTRESMKDFAPLFTLRYSATPRDRYNVVYRLDAVDAYNMKLVKRISVTGIQVNNAQATGGYVYLKGIVKSDEDPQALIEFDHRTKDGIKRVTRKVREGADLFGLSGGLAEYRNNFVVKTVDGLNGTLSFLNGIALAEGQICGSNEEDQKRRIQIRETIDSHLKKEQQLYRKGIKVLSLFFIDEVAKYRLYNSDGQAINGTYAQIFEEEYRDAVRNLQLEAGSEGYAEYLKGITAAKTHAGYFSVDKHNRMTDNVKKDGTTDDVSAYDLIMKDKERLLSLDEPVRFIFSHSALREGWDNPNVFQICTLRNTQGEIRRRQEVGRGLRLCVNQEGERVDGEHVNELTVIANESYAEFAAGLQQEIADSLSYRPKKVTSELFTSVGLKLSDYEQLIKKDYISDGNLTERYYSDKKDGTLDLPPEVMSVLDSVFTPESVKISDTRKQGAKITLHREKLELPEFVALWDRIKHRSVYSAKFADSELIARAVIAINDGLNVAQSTFMIVRGKLESTASRDALAAGQAFTRTNTRPQAMQSESGRVSFDLAGSLSGITGLTRELVVKILKGIAPAKLSMFTVNPEMFIAQSARIIDESKGIIVAEHISYNVLDESYDTEIFTDAEGSCDAERLTRELTRSLYDRVPCDSKTEQTFAESLDSAEDVSLFVKLPGGYKIDTPVGSYNPDWAIAFAQGSVKHVYLIAETKGSTSQLQLKPIEQIKAACARKHFATVSGGSVSYEVVDDYASLMNSAKR